MGESCIGLLKNELDFQRRKETTGYKTEAVSCKVADAKGEVNSLDDGLRRDTFDMYASIRHNVDQTLLAVSNCLKKLINGEAKWLQQKVHAALRNGASGVQKSFGNASGFVNRSLSLTVEHARHDESARSGSSSMLSVSRESRLGQTRATFDSEGAPTGGTP